MQPSPFLGELLGTLTLVYLGDGVCANVNLKKTIGHGSGWIVITTAWAFAVVMGVFVSTFFGSTDAHLNPAVTVAFAVKSGDFSNIVPYISAQMIGAFLGACLVWVQYLPHWKETDDTGAKLGSFCTGPAIKNTTANLLSEIMPTILLIVGIASFSSIGQVSDSLGPYLVGILVWVIGLSLGGSTGYAINPARDLGPRIAHAILPLGSKGSSNWEYAWIPVFGPILGAIIAGLVI